MFDAVTEAFLSQGRPIAVEVFQSGTIPQPAIIHLHGANGIATFHSWHRGLAALLAESGYAVFFVHYFDSTGTDFANLDVIRENFLVWHKTIVDAVAFVAERQDVISDSIAFLGFSLGATLSFSVAAQLPRIRAVAAFFGGVPDAGWRFIPSLPPTFIAHGEADPVVPVDQAYKMEEWLKQRNIPHELKIYPEEGHIFGEEAMSDSMASAIAFFDRYLHESSSSGPEEVASATEEASQPQPEEETVPARPATENEVDQQEGDDMPGTSPLR